MNKFKDKRDWFRIVWPKNLGKESDDRVWKFLFPLAGKYFVEDVIVSFEDEKDALAFMLTFGFKKVEPYPDWPFA